MTATVYCFQTGQILAPVINLRGGAVNGPPVPPKESSSPRELHACSDIPALTPAGRSQFFPGGDAA